MRLGWQFDQAEAEQQFISNKETTLVSNIHLLSTAFWYVSIFKLKTVGFYHLWWWCFPNCSVGQEYLKACGILQEVPIMIERL